MEIICHRGWWNEKEEQNSIKAFERAFDEGLGVEIDLRMESGDLVVSHDPWTLGSPYLSFFKVLELWKSYSHPLLAINIKCDGMAPELTKAMGEDFRDRWFTFDMSIPEMRKFTGCSLPVASRISEFEDADPNHTLHWVDCFDSDWWVHTESWRRDDDRHVVVSSELHGRSYVELWEATKSQGLFGICTDHPDEARDFFR